VEFFREELVAELALELTLCGGVQHLVFDLGVWWHVADDEPVLRIELEQEVEWVIIVHDSCLGIEMYFWS